MIDSVACRWCEGKLNSEDRFVHEPNCKWKEREAERSIIKIQLERMHTDLSSIQLLDTEPDGEIAHEITGLATLPVLFRSLMDREIIRMGTATKLITTVVEILHETIGERMQEIKGKGVTH